MKFELMILKLYDCFDFIFPLHLAESTEMIDDLPISPLGAFRIDGRDCMLNEMRQENN